MKNRSFGLDIFRLICICFIVIGHMQSESFIYTISFAEAPVDFLFQIIVGNFERVFINGFVMVSAWFLSGNSSSRAGTRLLHCWLMVFIVNVVVTIIASGCGVLPITSIFCLQAFFPIIGRPQWYMCEYMILLMTAPMIDAMINNISRIQHKFLLYLGIVLIVFVSSIKIVPASFTEPLFSEYIWFVFLYLLVAYLKFYPEAKLNCVGNVTWIAIVFVSSTIIILVNLLSYFYPASIMESVAFQYTSHYETIVGVLIPLGLFMLLKEYDGAAKRETIWRKCISLSAGCTGYIYIIHSVPVLWRNENYNIWENIFQMRLWYNRGLLILAMALTTVFIVAFGTVVGLFIEKTIMGRILSSKASVLIITKLDKTLSSADNIK